MPYPSSSSSLSVPPTAFSTYTVAPGLVKFQGDRLPVDRLPLHELKTRVANIEDSIQHARFSKPTLDKMAASAERMRARIAILEAEELTQALDATHLRSPEPEFPIIPYDPDARVVMRTKAMAVARPIHAPGAVRSISFAEAKPLEEMNWRIQKEQERLMEEEKESRRKRMEELGLTPDLLRLRRMNRARAVGEGGVAGLEEQMWAFMTYKDNHEEETLDYKLEFDDDDDEWTDHTTEEDMDSARDRAILPGSDDEYPPDPDGYHRVT